ESAVRKAEEHGSQGVQLQNRGSAPGDRRGMQKLPGVSSQERSGGGLNSRACVEKTQTKGAGSEDSPFLTPWHRANPIRGNHIRASLPDPESKYSPHPGPLVLDSLAHPAHGVFRGQNFDACEWRISKNLFYWPVERNEADIRYAESRRRNLDSLLR